MSREIDRREFNFNRVLPAEDTTQRTLTMANSGEPQPVDTDNYIQRALNFVRDQIQALGLEAVQPSEYAADPHIQKTSSGAVAVYLHQQYKSIPVFQATETVRFAPDGQIEDAVGNSVNLVEDVEASPQLSVQEAVLKAAQHVAVVDADEKNATDQFGEPLALAGVELNGFFPQIVDDSFANMPQQPTVLEAGPFADKIKASLIWFPFQNTLRLCWEVIITMPNYEGQYRTLVDAANGEILYCRQLIRFLAVQGNVYRHDGGGVRHFTEFPRALTDYGIAPVPNLPVGFPDGWVDVDSTIGNCARVYLQNSGTALQGAQQSASLIFDPIDSSGDDQDILNTFYFSCYLHDFFYLLGFREADGNFQQDNYGRGGIPGDPMVAYIHQGKVTGYAHISPIPADGQSPIMNLGLFERTRRHTSLDATVVFHEVAHGLNNRLVGGPMNERSLDEPQSRGMDEGWSDYFACTVSDTAAVAEWVTDQPGIGIRQYPYDSNYPKKFDSLGQPGYTREHAIGEIWCATLMELNRNIGVELALQLVVDAMKILPSNPSFLNGRDAILTALRHKQASGGLDPSRNSEVWHCVWATFAKFGMGPSARSNGSSLSGIVADFTTPHGSVVRLDTVVDSPIPDHNLEGVTSALKICQEGQVSHITVSVEIHHFYKTDLRVSLIAPSGRTAILHDRHSSLITSYASDTSVELASMLGEQAQGNWTLRVADVVPRHVGTFYSWSLRVAV